MGQLKEVKQWREKKGGISAIYREEGRRMGAPLLPPSFSQRPSGLLEPNKCGRKKSLNWLTPEEERRGGVAFFRSCNNSESQGRSFVLGFTEARGEERERERL